MNGVADVAQSMDEMGAGPDPDHDPADPTADPTADEVVLEDESPTTIWDHLTRSPSKSVHDADASEWFDPEAGGRDRLALVGEDVLGAEGVPNWVHLVVGVVEIMLAQQPDSDPDHDEPEAIPA